MSVELRFKIAPQAPTVVGEGLPEPIRIGGPAGQRIPVRCFGIGGVRRPVVMLHGLQSHSGWFGQSARSIAAQGHPVYAFDRAGSGVSAAETALGSRLEGLLAELDAVVDRAQADTGQDSVHILGHCFGAIVALMYASLHRPARVASLVLATPALYTRADLSPREKLRVLWSVLRHSRARVPVPLSPEQFSELPAFVDFVRTDPLALQTVPARLLFEVQRARRLLPRAARALHAPLLVAMAGSDLICDNRRTRHLLARVTTPMEVREYDGARHILEFSGQREAFLNDLATWFQERESR